MKYASLFIIILCVLASCSRKNEQELYKEALEAYAQENYQLAIDHYKEIVDRFSKTAYAESAQYHIAVIYNNDLHESRNAIQAYQKFHTMFPSSSEAATALFLTGFLYNNELHILDSARMAYEAFLQQYPSHSLATSAKFELETLGKDPGQYLNSQVATSEGKGDLQGKGSPHK